MKKDNGFTLVELLIAMVIGSIVMAAGYASFITQQKSYRTTESVSEIQQNLRFAMLAIEKDLRMAGFNPKKEIGFGFISPLNANSFTITKDYGSSDPANDENGTLETGETISYDLTSDTLRRNAGSGPKVFADKITNFELTYFDRNGLETTAASNVRSVLVKLTATDDGHTRELESLVKCRNMGL